MLVTGSGGREHALTWKIAQSPLVDRIFCAPGNPGMARIAEGLDIGVNDFDALVALARHRDVDLTVVGPEDPLAGGIVDAFAGAGLRAFGPCAEPEEEPGVTVFHAGTMSISDKLVTNGGWILNVTASGNDIPASIAQAYRAASHISFEGAHFRSDIGRKALDRFSHEKP